MSFALIERIVGKADAGQILRFGLVGTATAGVYLGLLWLETTLLGLSTLVASIGAFILAVGFNYALHKRWTFGDMQAHTRTGPRYVAMILGGLMINSAILYLGTDVLDLGFWGPQLLSIAAMVLYNYVILSQLIFGEPSKTG